MSDRSRFDREPSRAAPRSRRRLLLGAVAAVAALTAAAPRGTEADWPQFRGPGGQGRAEATGLLRSWGEGQPREAWRRPIGAGFSGVTVVGTRLYTMAVEEGQEVVLALDAATGRELWRTPLGESWEAFPEGGPRASPTVAADRVFTASSRGRVVALRADDGALVWERVLEESGPVPRFGYSVSPLVDGELVLVETGKKDESPGVLALDRDTGETVWGALEGPAGYSTPVAAEVDGVRQYVFFRRARAEVVALSTAGEVLWRHPTDGLAIIVSPVFVPPDRFFVATSDDSFGGLMLRVTRAGEAFAAEQVWSQRLMRNHFNSAVLVDGHLYGFDNATLRCIDAASGERRWARRGLGKGSLVAAGDLLYVLADDGTLVLVHADSAGYREAGRVQAATGRSWTAPSLAAGSLYVRDGDELVRLEIGGAPPDRPVAELAAPPVAAPPPLPAAPELTAAQVVARYVEARGGAERWRRLQGLRMRGRYAAFSQSSGFELIRRRGDWYRLDFEMLGGPAIRARDAEGTWGRHPLLMPQPGRISDGPYKEQFERESLFEPPLLDHAQKGVGVELLGPGEIDGRPTVNLRLTLPDGRQETWYLDAQSYLEVAVDSQVKDLTQLPEPMRQRAFFDDFREVEGLVVPFRVELEFGARLESMTVQELEVDPELAAAEFSPPTAEG